MKRKVLFVNLDVNRNVLPLTAGYLEAYACLDEEIANTHRFAHFSERLRTPREELLRRLREEDADVYGFGCYVWNMRLVRYLVDELATLRPAARIVLGGPQVDGHGANYLKPDRENVFVSNGEGERIFRDFLLAAHSGGDLEQVNGLTFYRDGELVTTPRAPLIEDINEIPSPYLSGVFRGVYSTTIFETNRGCPYACTFCYWGKGDDNSLRKFDTERLVAEIDWLGRNSISYIHFGDANWGILKRDVELSEEIVRCKERHGAPLMITFSAAKAQIGRSSKIATIFHDAGIVSAQAIGIQSTTDEVLARVRRRNIKLPALMEASIELERNGVSTYAELIWPLPGESFPSFKECLTTLCSTEVTSVVVYPAMLLHATPMEHQVEEFGIETVDADDDASELQLIVATRDVTVEETVDGVWLACGVYCLFNARTLRLLGKYLNDRKIVPWAELMWSFIRFCRDGDGSVAKHWRQVVAERRHAEQHALGELIHLVLHDRRDEFLSSLAEFARSQDWWQLEEARILFELDLVNCPYVYSNTPFTPVPESVGALEYFSVRPSGERQARVEIHPAVLELVSGYLPARDAGGSAAFDVSYQHKQFPFMPGKPMRENFTYVYGMIHRASVISPQWAPARRDREVSRPLPPVHAASQPRVVQELR